jgi:hypothetical protein
LKVHVGEENVKRVKDIIGEELQNTKKHVDWIACDYQNLYIFECKSSLLPVIARQTFIKSTLNRWVVGILIKSMEQLENTATLIKDNGFIISREVYKYVVLLEELHFAEYPDFKTSIMEELRKKKNLNCSDTYLMNISELEEMEETIKKYGFARILEKKKEIDRSKNIALSTDFISVCREIDSNFKMRSVFLEKIFNETISKLNIFGEV